ncbi:MAG: hypothetical protein HY928_08415 [Elusimicrobia bacterium]|nr:hypothetical protein [Elusimicrobiota bacterium]
MARKNLRAWLFDSSAGDAGVRVWLIGGDGRASSCLDPWRPVIRCARRGEAGEQARALLRARLGAAPAEASGVELFSGELTPVWEARASPARQRRLTGELKDLGAELYDADINPLQAWHYERGHFPLAFGEFALEDGVLRGCELQDDRWAVDYPLPPLRVIGLRLSGSETAGRVDPNHAPRGSLLIESDGRVAELEGPLQLQLETLAEHLKAADPDVLETDWGDSWLLPALAEASERLKVPLPFSRDGGHRLKAQGGRSFYTYGRAVYQNGSVYLRGRWHLDRRNSFMLRECGADGLFEVARLAALPVQRAARSTIGTALSSMQMLEAVRSGILVPSAKAQTEDFRPADEFLVADKGGLVYVPEPGWHGESAEFDFASMYPTLMVDKNISPETVNCPCCSDNRVPDLGHWLCRRRPGLVPRVLSPLLKKRAAYKALSKTDHPDRASYKARASAHKWILVCCFGYLGYSNARFGKIEAHECVTAWGREVLLRAKEAVERRGFRMLHALVDSVWVEGRPGADYEALRRAIEDEAGCPVALEGVTKWLRFCPSKEDSLVGVPARYFCAFQGGELKARGLAYRRRDTPLLLKRMQEEMLALLEQAPDLSSAKALLPRLKAVAEGYRQRLKDGNASAEELAVSVHLSRDPAKYKTDTHNAIAARALLRAGLTLHPGETLRYVISSAKDPVKDWRVTPLALLEGPLEYDPKRYGELLDRAEREILDGLDAPPEQLRLF